MDKISLLVQEWYQTHNRVVLKQIFEEIQESNINFFGACFKTWTNKGAIDDANECIQRFNISLYEKLTKENDPTPITNFEPYYKTVRRRVFLNFRRVQQKTQETHLDPTDPTNGQELLDRRANDSSLDTEDEIWRLYKLFMKGKATNLSYIIFENRIENKMSHDEIAAQLNKKLELKGEQMLTATKVRKRYSKLLDKWRKFCKDRFHP